MISAKNSGRVPAPQAPLLTLLEQAIRRFDEPVFVEVHEALLTEDEPFPPDTDHTSQGELLRADNSEFRPASSRVRGNREWYEENRRRLLIERIELERVLTPLPECPGLFFLDKGSGQLGVMGLVRVAGELDIRIEILYPRNYPASPPTAFFSGTGVRDLRHLLQQDGAVPILSGNGQGWCPTATGADIVSWAIDWLESVADLRALPRE